MYLEVYGSIVGVCWDFVWKKCIDYIFVHEGKT